VYSILFAGDECGGLPAGFGGPRIGMGWLGGSSGHRRYPQQQSVDQKTVLDRLSRETGAHMYEVSKKESIDEIYARTEEELRHQYIIGYSPDRANPGTSYHKIHLTTKQRDLVVQTRDGYYSDK
jgi:VWFA-related protein